MERKSFIVPLIEVKFDGGDANSQRGHFSGYASVWDSVDLGGDMVRAGAFQKTLASWSEKGMMPQLLYYHDMGEVIGEWKVMAEDEKGLYVEGFLWIAEDNKLECAQKAYNILRSNSVKGLSIGYRVNDYDEKTLMDGTKIRELKEIDLLEVSIAPWAMEPKASVTSVKSLAGKDGQIVSKREVEKALRDAGLSVRQAKAFISQGYDAIGRDDQSVYDGLLASLDRLSQQLKGVSK